MFGLGDVGSSSFFFSWLRFIVVSTQIDLYILIRPASNLHVMAVADIIHARDQLVQSKGTEGPWLTVCTHYLNLNAPS